MGSVVKMFGDGLRNLVANLGTPRDKMAGSFHTLDFIDDASLSAMYRGAWLPRKIVDIPAFDSCREWRIWSGSQEQIEALEKFEAKFNLKCKVFQALVASRLYGGAAIYIGTGEADPSLPLDVERIRKDGIKYLTVVPKSRLNAAALELNPESEHYGKPALWNLCGANGNLIRVHPSRLVVFIGGQLPNDDLMAATGWGDSVLLPVYEAVKQADSTTANIASLVFEAKIDVIRIPDLMNNLSQPSYENNLIKRFQLAATGKGINGSLILDKEEEYNQKSASFATLPELMDRFFQNVAGAADIPMTRLFGHSPGGMNATGESDVRNYYDRISAIQELDISPAMAVLNECIIRAALGSRPPEVHVEWAPLWQTSEKEKAEIGKIVTSTAKELSDMQLYAVEALAEATKNALVEAGAMPGLEGAVGKYGAFESDENNIDQVAAATTTPNSESVEREDFRKRVADAMIKPAVAVEAPKETIADSLERIVKAMPQPTFNVDVKTPDVKIEQAPITVNTPAITVEPAQVTVNVPDMQMPPVNVVVQPAQVMAGDVKVDVHMPKAGVVDTTVEEYDDKGRIKRTRAKPVEE